MWLRLRWSLKDKRASLLTRMRAFNAPLIAVSFTTNINSDTDNPSKEACLSVASSSGMLCTWLISNAGAACFRLVSPEYQAIEIDRGETLHNFIRLSSGMNTLNRGAYIVLLSHETNTTIRIDNDQVEPVGSD